MLGVRLNQDTLVRKWKKCTCILHMLDNAGYRYDITCHQVFQLVFLAS